MGVLKYLVIHCTATPQGRAVSKSDIIRWHTAPKSKGGRGWSRAGYSDMIHLDGRIENIIAFNQDGIVDPWELSNGVRGINGVSRHIVYVGGLARAIANEKADKKANEKERKKFIAKDTRTLKQQYALEAYVNYMILRYPDIKVCGHNQFASKACPSFDVPTWLKSIGIEEKNIYRSLKI